MRSFLIRSWDVRKGSSLPPKKAKPRKAGAIFGLSDTVRRKSARGKETQTSQGRNTETSRPILPRTCLVLTIKLLGPGPHPQIWANMEGWLATSWRKGSVRKMLNPFTYPLSPKDVETEPALLGMHLREVSPGIYLHHFELSSWHLQPKMLTHSPKECVTIQLAR